MMEHFDGTYSILKRKNTLCGWIRVTLSHYPSKRFLDFPILLLKVAYYPEFVSG